MLYSKTWFVIKSNPKNIRFLIHILPNIGKKCIKNLMFLGLLLITNQVLEYNRKMKMMMQKMKMSMIVKWKKI
jgi:hypothetical protein